MKKILLSTLLLGVSMSSAYAANVSGTFQANAKIEKSCLVSVNDINFGEYDPSLNTITQASESLFVKCTNNVPYKIGIDRFEDEAWISNSPSPLAYSGGKAPLLINQSNPIANGVIVNGFTNNGLIYQLYTDSNRTKVWNGFTNHYIDDGDLGKFIGIGSGETQELKYYASLDKNQYVKEGTYIGKLLVTTEF